MVWRGFCLLAAGRWSSSASGFFGKFWANYPALLANSGHANAGPAQPTSDSRRLLKPFQVKAGDAPCAAAKKANTASSQWRLDRSRLDTPMGSQPVGTKRKSCGSVWARAPPQGCGRTLFRRVSLHFLPPPSE